MSADRRNSDQDLLDRSGFPLQLALERRIRETEGAHGYRVFGTEHPWATGGEQGFIDILLQSRRDRSHLVLECKRATKGVYLFFETESEQAKCTDACVYWLKAPPHVEVRSGWDVLSFVPASPESAFCQIRGAEKSQSLLERIAQHVIRSVESLGTQFAEMDLGGAGPRVLVPVIVTTAFLRVAKFDPASVNLETGTTSDVEFRDVPYLRFRKSLAGPAPPDHMDTWGLEDIAIGSERTVFVVRANEVVSWLEEFEIKQDRFGRWPWEFGPGS